MTRAAPVIVTLATIIAMLHGGLAELAAEGLSESNESIDRAMFPRLDAPLLFVKRHSYSGIHIYDTYYKWPPGGGGIYVIENPSSPKAEWKIRPIIDETTSESLGHGVYNDPELSWDGQRLLFCFKGEPHGSTSIYEIGVDGHGLQRLTDPTPTLSNYKGVHGGQHDVCPAYLADGRIVFLSTRASGLVPCANSGVAILHVMNADGSDIHSISVNNVNEFDPSVLPDGRLLFGRWEYVDKNALTIQSLWTMNPDGTQETALFANNMVFPESILDSRPVPNSHLIVGTFSKHNSTPRGTIAMIDPRVGKNDPKAIFNFERPDRPTVDVGDSCEPWPLSEDLVLFSGRPPGGKRNVLEMIDRLGKRVVVHADPEFCLHSPMLVKPRLRPNVISDTVDRKARTGRFFVRDIYEGLDGVERGEVKWLRVLEETSRTSERTDGPNPYNQTFLVSSALAFSVKNFLGVVPVEEDGSAYFEVPAGRAVYLQALDADGRLVRSMRTFVQAAPGTTRSCIGCHEHKFTASRPATDLPVTLRRSPSQMEPESWGSGYVDYARMIQPILDRHCVRCHGGDEGIAAGMDLSGGWTEHFNISYESLTNRTKTQLVAYWISGIDCMNGTALWSSQIFAPRAHGSGAAPLAELLIDGHGGRIKDLTRAERDLIFAWIDTNGLYYGTWNRTASGCAISGWGAMKARLTGQMREAGCLECHGKSGRLVYFENDWVNLQRPEFSRILRAPLATEGSGHGLAWCRRRKVTPDRQRIHLLWNGYAHAVQAPEKFALHEPVRPDRTGEPVVSFASIEDRHYQKMLGAIRSVRARTLAAPRVDMPGANVLAGDCRFLVPPVLSADPITLVARADSDGAVRLSWDQTARTIGLKFELYRSDRAGFVLDASALIVRTPLARHTDWTAPVGRQVYALVPVSGGQRGAVSFASVVVPEPAPPAPPQDLRVVPASGVVRLEWYAPPGRLAGYHVYRADRGSARFQKITKEPIRSSSFVDMLAESGKPYIYVVRSVSRRLVESQPTSAVEATARVIKEPVFNAFADQAAAVARVVGGTTVNGQEHGSAIVKDGMLDLRKGGHVTFPHDDRFDLSQPLSVEVRVRFEQPGQMPVILSCGAWNQAGWFLQRFGDQVRWHVGGVDCDGGSPRVGQWIQITATWDGRQARLFVDGQLVAERRGTFNTKSWPGALHIGQYSGQPSPPYQVLGQLKDVRIFHRALAAEEIAARFEAAD